MAQTYEANQDGIDLIWSSWDDGNNNTWEGEFDAFNNNTGDWGVWTAQLDVSSEQTMLNTIWATFQDGSNGHGPYPVKGLDPFTSGIVAISAGDRGGAPQLQLVGWKGDFRG